LFAIVRARFAWLTLAARTLAAFRTFRALRAIAALAALKTGLTAFFARLTRLTRFAGFAWFTTFALLTAFAALRAETVAAAAIVAATAEITVATITTIELLLALALWEISVGLLAAAVGGLGFALGAFAIDAALLIAFVIVLEAIVVHLLHRHRGLHLTHEAEIVIGVLHVIFAEHAVAGRRCVAGELQIAFKDQGCVATHLAALRPVTLHRPIGMEISATAAAVVMTAAGLTTAASLTLH